LKKSFPRRAKVIDTDDFAAVVAGLAKLRHRQYHREPLSKALGDGLFELRHVGKLNTRVLWFFMRNRRIIAVHVELTPASKRSWAVSLLTSAQIELQERRIAP
jgi:Phage derived protein Gp49-like (DUF891)